MGSFHFCAGFLSTHRQVCRKLMQEKDSANRCYEGKLQAHRQVGDISGSNLLKLVEDFNLVGGKSYYTWEKKTWEKKSKEQL